MKSWSRSPEGSTTWFLSEEIKHIPQQWVRYNCHQNEHCKESLVASQNYFCCSRVGCPSVKMHTTLFSYWSNWMCCFSVLIPQSRQWSTWTKFLFFQCRNWVSGEYTSREYFLRCHVSASRSNQEIEKCAPKSTTYKSLFLSCALAFCLLYQLKLVSSHLDCNIFPDKKLFGPVGYWKGSNIPRRGFSSPL